MRRGILCREPGAGAGATLTGVNGTSSGQHAGLGASGCTTLLVAAGAALIRQLLVALVGKLARFVVGMSPVR